MERGVPERLHAYQNRMETIMHQVNQSDTMKVFALLTRERINAKVWFDPISETVNVELIHIASSHLTVSLLDEEYLDYNGAEFDLTSWTRCL